MTIKTQSQQLQFKQALKAKCINLLEQRLNNAAEAMQQALDASISEGKSSAGDKHEVGRAMGHIEAEMNARQISNTQIELQQLMVIDVSQIFKTVVNGSVVGINDQVFFMAAGLGAIDIEGVKIVTLSPQAPLSKVLMNKVPGDRFSFNSNYFEIMFLY